MGDRSQWQKAKSALNFMLIPYESYDGVLKTPAYRTTKLFPQAERAAPLKTDNDPEVPYTSTRWTRRPIRVKTPQGMRPPWPLRGRRR